MIGKRTLPLLILAGGVLLALLVWITRPRVEAERPSPPPPLVHVQEVKTQPYQFTVSGYGTVAPRTETDLVPQVSGEVVWVSPSLRPGGFFETDEPLLRIEAIDYEAQLESARAALARARSEERRARKELERQRRLAGQSIASQARIDDTENAFAVAQAVRREAAASLGRAERDLARTVLSAPYDGRVRSETVDVGQFVNRGSPIAQLYAVDYAEVRLPLPDRELRYLDLPLSYREGGTGSEPAAAPGEVAAADAGDGSGATPGGGEPPADAGAAETSPVEGLASSPTSSGPPVELSAEFAGTIHTWQGRIVRTEGEIDPRSRMVTVVARVEDPYGRESAGDRPPLAVGLFVAAEIEGRAIEDAVLLPRSALHGTHRVLVLDAESRLHFREVEVLRREREEIVIGAGLEEGERVCISPLPAAVEGMTVRATTAQAELAGAPR